MNEKTLAFIKKLKTEQFEFYNKLELLEDIKGVRTKCLFKDKYGELLIYPNQLLKGIKWTIQLAVDKNKYFLNMLRDVNTDLANELEFVDNFISLDKYVVFKNRYGLIRVKPNNLLNGNTPTIQSSINKNEYFLSMLKENNLEAYNSLKMLGDYNGNKDKIEFEHEGSIVYITPNQLLQGHYFTIRSFSDKTSEWIKKAKVIHNNKYDYSRFNYDEEFAKIICPIHGEFLQNKSYHLQGCGCRQCNYSKGERSVSDFLIRNKINFTPQYQFKDCKNIKQLIFDFYLHDLNICIEYDGEQHFRPIDVFGGEDEYENTKIRDSIKTKYCEENNIKLIRIPYYEFNNMEYILKDLIN